MAIIGRERWESLEKWRSIAFLIGGVLLGADAALVAGTIITDGDFPMALGQGLIGAGWTAASIGLLGLYPRLADRSRWLARAGAVFAVIGIVTYTAMAVTSFGYFTGVLDGELSDVVAVFLPGVFLGTVLGFGAFGVASLRTNSYSRTIGLLLLVLPITFLFNIGTGIAGFNPLAKVLVVVCVLTLTMLSIGYQFRTGSARAHDDETLTVT